MRIFLVLVVAVALGILAAAPAFAAVRSTDVDSRASTQIQADLSDEASDSEEADSEDADSEDEDSGERPDWVDDVTENGGPPSWVEDVKTDGGPPAWVPDHRATPPGH